MRNIKIIIIAVSILFASCATDFRTLVENSASYQAAIEYIQKDTALIRCYKTNYNIDKGKLNLFVASRPYKMSICWYDDKIIEDSLELTLDKYFVSYKDIDYQKLKEIEEKLEPEREFFKNWNYKFKDSIDTSKYDAIVEFSKIFGNFFTVTVRYVNYKDPVEYFKVQYAETKYLFVVDYDVIEAVLSQENYLSLEPTRYNRIRQQE